MLRINLRNMRSDFLPVLCGYCKDPNTNIYKRTAYKYDLVLKSIPVDILEEMVSKGWTRCGNLIYFNIYEKTCCKLYQPRLNINNFKISNEQKKIMKRFRKYLSGEYEENKLKKKEIKPKKKIIEDNFKNNISQKVKEYINSRNFLNCLKKYIKNEKEIQIYMNKLKETKIRRITNKKCNFNYSCDLIYIIKNIYSSQFIKNKNNNNINQINYNKSIINSSKNFFNDLYNNFIQNYKSKEENIYFNEETGHINFQIKNQEKYKKFIDEITKNETINISYNINNNIQNYNKNINNKEIKISNKINIEKINKMENKDVENIKGNIYKNQNNININKIFDIKKEKKLKYNFDYFPEFISEPEIYLPLKHTYTIELTNNIVLNEYEERFLLYKKYEQTIHKEKNVKLSDHNNYWGHLLLQQNKKKIPLPSNLKEKTPHPELYPQFYGTYNLIHRIDHKIVAVTVIDILPHTLISAYCYYDPDFSFLDLGVITAIRELEYMKSFNNLIDNNFIYYTMGEMCQSCQKLKYKGNYIPTEIMDYYTGKYVYLTEEIKKIIGDNKCHFLADNQYNSRVKYFSKFEIEEKYFNLLVNVFGEKIYIDEFLDLYLEGEDNLKNNIVVNLKRFLEVIDKEIYSKIEFYYEA